MNITVRSNYGIGETTIRVKQWPNGVLVLSRTALQRAKKRICVPGSDFLRIETPAGYEPFEPTSYDEAIAWPLEPKHD